MFKKTNYNNLKIYESPDITQNLITVNFKIDANNINNVSNNLTNKLQ